MSKDVDLLGSTITWQKYASLTHWLPGDSPVILEKIESHGKDRYINHLLQDWPQVNDTKRD